MKAWRLSIANDDDQGQAIVFADNTTDAKKKICETNLDADSWIYIRARRCSELDDMENVSEVERFIVLWRDGWIWYDYLTPNPDETSDDEFRNWYKNTFREVN